MSASMTSAAILSCSDAFPFLSVMMAFLISTFVGFLQLMGNSVSAGGMSGNNSGAGRFSNSLKCSVYHFSCPLLSSVVFRLCPLLACQSAGTYLPAS